MGKKSAKKAGTRKKDAKKAASKKKDDDGPVDVPEGSDKTVAEHKDKTGSVVEGSDGSSRKGTLRSGTAPKLSDREMADAALAHRLQQRSEQGKSESDVSSSMSDAGGAGKGRRGGAGGSKKTPSSGKGAGKEKGDSGKSEKEGSGSSSDSGFSSGGGGKDSGEKKGNKFGGSKSGGKALNSKKKKEEVWEESDSEEKFDDFQDRRPRNQGHHDHRQASSSEDSYERSLALYNRYLVERKLKGGRKQDRRGFGGYVRGKESRHGTKRRGKSRVRSRSRSGSRRRRNGRGGHGRERRSGRPRSGSRSGGRRSRRQRERRRHRSQSSSSGSSSRSRSRSREKSRRKSRAVQWDHQFDLCYQAAEELGFLSMRRYVSSLCSALPSLRKDSGKNSVREISMLAAVMDALEDDDIELVKTLVGCRVMGMVVAHKFPKPDGNPNWNATISLQPAQMAGINLDNVAEIMSLSNRMAAGQNGAASRKGAGGDC